MSLLTPTLRHKQSIADPDVTYTYALRMINHQEGGAAQGTQNHNKWVRLWLWGGQAGQRLRWLCLGERMGVS